MLEMPLINVISPDSGFGNTKDAEIVGAVLRARGLEVNLCSIPDYEKRTRIGVLANHMARRWRRFDLNLFLGPVFREWLPMARRNVIVPNPECFVRGWLGLLRQFDLVLAKTRVAEGIFRSLGCRAEFVSFTSPDRAAAAPKKDRASFLHVSSTDNKGTNRLLEFWSEHPDWPVLTAVLSRGSPRPDFGAENIRRIARYVPDEELLAMQNSHGVHVCCSEAEGFGHYIAEAMSTRAVVMTTDGPPMNELVDPSRGVLVAYSGTRESCLSTAYLIDRRQFEASVERVLAMTDAERNTLGCRARGWFETNDAFFRARLPEIVEQELRRP
jgi:glycosyltransferase involved in cell wall biosynthesis